MSARSGASPKATLADRAVHAPRVNSYGANARLTWTKLLKSGSTILNNLVVLIASTVLVIRLSTS